MANQHHPSARELDDLELLTGGAFHPTTGFNEPGSAVTLRLPDEIEAALADGEAVELVDPEGLPLATVTADGSAEGRLEVTALTHAQYGPFRRYYLTPAQVREQYAGRTVVAVTDALTDVQVAQLRTLGPVLLVALVGTGTPALSAVGLIRATLRLAGDLDAAVVAVPLASHDDPAADAELRQRVLAAYAGPDPVVELATGGELVLAVADIVADEHPAKEEQGLVLFFTGLSGSGKSTLARALMDRILEQGGRTLTSLDGDVVRRNLSAGLTFSKEDRETNIRRIGWVAAEISRHGGLAVCSPIAPFDETRQQVRKYVEDAGGAFFLVHVATPLEECERRDRKGLYAKARRGEIPEFTGISSPYEEPQDADVRVDTTGRTIEDALDDVIVALRESGYLNLSSEASRLASLAPQPPRAEVIEMRGEPDADLEPNADQRALSVLFVCTANICRSPYMELRARSLMANASDAPLIEFASAGTHGFREHPADPTMAEVMAARGVPQKQIDAFTSRRLSRKLVETADLVLTAEGTHRAYVLEEVPASFRKVFTLGQFAESITRVDPGLSGAQLLAAVGHRRAGTAPAHDVADPYNRGLPAAEQAADQIDSLLRVVLPQLTGSERIVP
ncbi:adenylyl-sulfate kinase [Nocardioides panacisoli]|uniref:Adenylyl-sulfate kinase n=1 Tax=Nocardioides panacisoli TaxID=627624 RepID=A0ABP7IX19_9ACTN